MEQPYRWFRLVGTDIFVLAYDEEEALEKIIDPVAADDYTDADGAFHYLERCSLRPEVESCDD